jgi:methylmalonyl-CoA/ethylmalonyl-CoA epimerase
MADETPSIRRLEEVAIAVPDASSAVDTFHSLFGLSFEDTWTVPDEGIRVRAAFIGETQIQLLEPLTDESPISSFLEQRGAGLHHVCFRADDLDAMVKHLRSAGIRTIPETPVETETISYVFVHPKSAHGVLIELLEGGPFPPETDSIE